MAIGLGNPGASYQDTRHNIGFKAIDKLAERLNIYLKKPFLKRYLIGKGVHEGEVLYLIKPLTFMNRSGEIVTNILKRTKSANTDLLIICDTLDLPVGVCRLKRKGSAGGHRGLASLSQYLKTDEFPRLVIGVGRPQTKDDVINFVLGVPSPEENKLLTEAINQTSESVLRLLHEPLEKVTNDFNKKRDGN